MIYYRIIHKDINNSFNINSWTEKRIGFIEFLKNKYGNVYFISKQNLLIESKKDDLLFLEFGSNNLSWYQEDINFTYNLVNNFAGKIIYLNDDPDLLDNIKPIKHKINLILFSGNINYLKFDCKKQFFM